MLKWLLGRNRSDENTRDDDERTRPNGPPPDPKGDPKREGTPGDRFEEFGLRSKCPPPASPRNAAEACLENMADAIMRDCETLLSSSDFELPMLPGVAVKLLQMLARTDVSPGAVSETVKYDQVLTGKFLSAVNSAHFGASKRIESVDHATAILGMNAVRNLVTSAAFHSTPPAVGHLVRDVDEGPTSSSRPGEA